MQQRRLVVLLFAVTAAVAACGSSGDSDSVAGSATLDGAVVAVGAAPLPGDAVGSIGDAVEVAAGAPGQANDAACDIERKTLDLASDAYAALNGALPTSQQDLLDDQLIRELSTLFDIDANGAVIVAPGSPCT